MRAAVLHSYGSLPVAGNFREPTPQGGGQTLVDVAVAGLNPVDILIAGGALPGLEPQLPSVVGLEGIGRIDGRRCYFDRPVAPFGSFAEQALVDRASLIDVPDGVSDELAVSLGNAGLAAWLALDWRAGLASGESVLVLGSSGVVGQIALQAAQLLGAGSVFAAARDEQSLDRARDELGADATVTIGGDFDELTRRFADVAADGFDVVIDTLWGAPAAAAVTALRPDGRLVQLGNSAGPVAELPALAALGRLTAVLAHVNFMAPQQVKADAFQRMCRHAAAGELDVPVERIGLEAIGEAWERQQHSPRLKLVVDPRATRPGAYSG